MADSSASSAGSSAHHIDVEIEQDVRAAAHIEPKDEEMGDDSTPAAAGAQTPQSVDSDLASTFYTTTAKKRATASRLTTDPQPTTAAADQDDDKDNDNDDMMEPEVRGREERLLDENVRARYIQEIGDIF